MTYKIPVDNILEQHSSYSDIFTSFNIQPQIHIQKRNRIHKFQTVFGEYGEMNVFSLLGTES